MAAVRPAGPDPMMSTLRTSFTLPASLTRSDGALPPQQQAGEQEDSAGHHVGGPHVAGDGDVEHADEQDREEDERRHAEDRGHQPVHEDAGHALEAPGGLAADAA